MKADPVASFIRSFQRLLTSARLYSLDHPRTAQQLEPAWTALRELLSQHEQLTLGAAADRLLLNGEPFEPAPADRSFARSFASLLNSADLTSLQFHTAITREEFLSFLRAFTAPPKDLSLAQHLENELRRAGIESIRVNVVRYVAEDAQAAEAPPSSAIASSILSQVLAEGAGALPEWAGDPRAMLQYIVAASAPSGPAATTPAPGDESDLVAVINLLRQLAQPATDPASQAKQVEAGRALPTHLAQLGREARESLHQAATALTQSGPSRAHPLVELAEHMAISYAIQQYEAGHTRVHAVQQLLYRLSSEIETLRQLVGAQEAELLQAGVTPEPAAELLDRQFWASVPASGKREVLLSPEAWCIPPRNVRSYLEELYAANDTAQAKAILSNYAECVLAEEVEGRQKAAAGMRALVDLYLQGSEEVLTGAATALVTQLGGETDAGLQQQLAKTLLELVAKSRGATASALTGCALEAAERLQKLGDSALATQIENQVLAQPHLEQLLQTALTSTTLPPLLPHILAKVPYPAAEILARWFQPDTAIETKKRIRTLAEQLGESGAEYFRKQFDSGVAAAGLPVLGLFTSLAPETVLSRLPAMFRRWERREQDAALQHIVGAGCPQVGQILLQLLPLAHEHVLPALLDELGMCEFQEAGPVLLKLAEDRSADAFRRIKAVEALGRLRWAGAKPTLEKILLARSVLRWEEPQELRLCAAQSLLQIDPAHGPELVAQAKLSAEELRVGPPKTSYEAPWRRQRAYERTWLQPMPAATLEVGGRSHAGYVAVLALGGAFVKTSATFPPGTLLAFQSTLGRYTVRSTAMVRSVSKEGVGIQFVHQKPEERTKLRRFLAEVTAGR